MTDLFVSGSLTDPRCLDEVLGYRFAGERLRGQLRGYERLTSPRFEYPFLVRRDGGVVEGVVVMGLGPSDLAVLDRYEEVDSGLYGRVGVDEVDVWGCGPHSMHLPAETYVAGPALLQLTGIAAARASASTTS